MNGCPWCLGIHPGQWCPPLDADQLAAIAGGDGVDAWPDEDTGLLYGEMRQWPT